MSQQPWFFNVEDRIGNLCLNLPETEVNVLNFETLAVLDRMLDEIASRRDIDAMVITSAKPAIFIAGADIKEIETITGPDDAFDKAERGKAIFQKLERLEIPTVCVINGACLGGGYELALACRGRVASFGAQVKIGLPEVNLGILPGFGGCVRLTRLLGLTRALPLILAGRIVGAQEALKIGMVDKLFAEATLLSGVRQFARALAAGEPPRVKRKMNRITRFLENTAPGRAVVFARAQRDVLSKTKGAYPAPIEVIRFLRATRGATAKDAFRVESLHFSRLAATSVSKNLIGLFFLSEKYKKRRWTESALTHDGVGKCGVIGAGIMGGGIAHLVSSRDIPVRMKDVNEKALGGALAEAARIYRLGLKKRKIKRHEIVNKMSLISAGLSDDGLKNCGVIIEAVVEDMAVKKKVLSGLSVITGPEVILASNTSSLSVSEMAEVCRYPERVAGLHFFNPVHRMPLVEVVRGRQSSPETIERMVLFARRLGKTAIVVEDKPGFLINRLLLPYMNEAAHLLTEGMAPDRIDTIAKKFGMPMGPIELADQVGIDVGVKVAHILEKAFGSRMKTAALLEKVSQKGLLGKKSGRGFYLYAKDGHKISPNPEIVSLTANKSKTSDEDALKRMMVIMINEASRCLEEHVTDSAASVDIGLVMGAGFPPFRGGLLRYADSLTAGAILSDLRRFQNRFDPHRFEPAPYLERLASGNRCFYA